MAKRTELFGLICLYGLGIVLTTAVANGQQRLIRIGERRLSINCAGSPSSQSKTAILIAGGGGTMKDWARVQPAVSQFTRVCSYDAAGLGDSDKTIERQSADEIVEDLHALLKASAEQKPYILVGHSMGGIYARKFTIKYAADVAAFVFVDSSHEEQAWRLHEIDPAGPVLSDAFARGGFIARQGERLSWRTELPLIVIGRGKPFTRTSQLTEQQFAAWDRIWQEMQLDLAHRSPKGQYRSAANSGHMIPNEEPELVIQAIRDVSAIR